MSHAHAAAEVRFAPAESEGTKMLDVCVPKLTALDEAAVIDGTGLYLIRYLCAVWLSMTERVVPVQRQHEDSHRAKTQRHRPVLQMCCGDTSFV